MTPHLMQEIASLLQISPWPPHAGLLLWLALTLMGGALLGGAVQRFLKLPRVLGYGAAGVLLALLGWGQTDEALQGNDRLIIDLALAVLLFEVGSRVSLRWLRVNKALLLASAVESLLGFAAVFYVLRMTNFALDTALAGAVVLGTTAGALIGRVAGESRAAGQVSDRMIVLAALNMLYGVLLMRLLLGWLYVGHRDDLMSGLAQTLYAFGGAGLLAVGLALAVGRVLRSFDLHDENAVLLLLGLLLLAVTLARMFNLSTLLVPLLAGVCLRNLSERPCIWPRHFGTAGGILVLVLFVLVGATWSTNAMLTGGLVALLAWSARALVKGLGLVGLARLSGIAPRQGLALALTQAPVAETALVLLVDLQATHPQIAQQLAPVVLSSTAVMVLAGPILVHLGLRLAKELP